MHTSVKGSNHLQGGIHHSPSRRLIEELANEWNRGHLRHNRSGFPCIIQVIQSISRKRAKPAKMFLCDLCGLARDTNLAGKPIPASLCFPLGLVAGLAPLRSSSRTRRREQGNPWGQQKDSDLRGLASGAWRTYRPCYRTRRGN